MEEKKISNMELKRIKIRKTIEFAHGDYPSNSELERVRKIIADSKITKKIKGVEMNFIQLKNGTLAVNEGTFLCLGYKNLLNEKLTYEKRIVALRNLDSGVFDSLGSPSFAIYLYVIEGL